MISKTAADLIFRPRYVPNPDITALGGATLEKVAGMGRSQVKLMRKALMANSDLRRDYVHSIPAAKYDSTEVEARGMKPAEPRLDWVSLLRPPEEAIWFPMKCICSIGMPLPSLAMGDVSRGAEVCKTHRGASARKLDV